MKYKLPILTGLVLVGFILYGAENAYQSTSIFPKLNAQTASTVENNSSLNIGIPVDTDGNPMDTTAQPQGKTQAAAEELLTDSKAILKRAIVQLHSESRFQASVRHKIHMFDQQLVGTGHYRQFGNDSIKRLRFELKTQVGEKTSSVIQVCDGRHLWTRENLTEGTTLSRIDVRFIQDELAEYERENGVGKFTANWGANIAMGGLPRLLTSIDLCFDFRSVKEATYEDIPVWVMVGTWKSEVKERIIEQFNIDPVQLFAIEPPIFALEQTVFDNVILNVANLGIGIKYKTYKHFLSFSTWKLLVHLMVVAINAYYLIISWYHIAWIACISPI